MNYAVRTLATCAALLAMVALFAAAAVEVLIRGKAILSDFED
jgi:hypothetical protein